MSSSSFDFISGPEQAAITARTSTYDATADLQAWLDFCQDNRVKGILEPGRYRITGPLFVTETALETCHIEGEGLGTADQNTKSELEATQLDTPALCIQYGRAVRIANIAIIGANIAPDSVDAPSKDQSDYISPGVRTSRYSPYAGICIDPAVGNVPPDGGYPGMSYQSGGGGTAAAVLENVSIRNFAVGVMISPDGESSQGDNIRINKCDIHYCDILISVGQTQNRSVTVTESDLGHCRWVAVGDEHGAQLGVPLSVSSSQIIRAYGLLRFSSALGVMSLTGIYAENIVSIGRWGVGFSSRTFPLKIDSCDFNFALALDARSAPFLLESYAPTHIVASALQRGEPLETMNFIGGASILFTTCTFFGTWDAETALIGQRVASNITRFLNCEVQGDGGDVLRLNRLRVNPSNTLTIRNLTNIIFTADEVEFTSVDVGTRALVGRLIFWKILQQNLSLISHEPPSLIVTSIAGKTATCRKLFHSDSYDETSTRAFVASSLYTRDT